MCLCVLVSKGGFVKLAFFIVTLCLSLLTYTNSAQAAEPANQNIVVLVPGFFSSITSEYFSKEVRNAFVAQGFRVYVIDNLNPVGTVEDNGTRLIKDLERIEATEKKHVNFNIVAHSAGGLYTLFAAHTQKFTIKNLLSVSTPYAGVEFIEHWLKNSKAFNALTSVAHLDGLKQLSPRLIAPFMNSVRVPSDMRITAFGGTQKKGLDISNAKTLSLPFYVTSAHISSVSDGIVGLNSALAVGSIMTVDNTRALQTAQSDNQINLDHWEQVLTADSFFFMGIRNPSYIRNEQTRFYTGLATYLKNLM